MKIKDRREGTVEEIVSNNSISFDFQENKLSIN